jgi:hypothetical protein
VPVKRFFRSAGFLRDDLHRRIGEPAVEKDTFGNRSNFLPAFLAARHAAHCFFGAILRRH